MNIPSIFIRQASNILGDTNTGLSGSKIAEIMSSYAYDLDVKITYPFYPFPFTFSPNNIKEFRSLLIR